MDSHREMVCDPILASLRYPVSYPICPRWDLAKCLGSLAPFRRAVVLLAGFAVDIETAIAIEVGCLGL